VPENVVKYVGLLQIIHLGFRADEGAGRKAAIGKMVEENVVGYELPDWNDAPAGQFCQPVAQLLHVGNAGFGKRELLDHRDEFLASAIAQNPLRALEQPIPALVFGGV
jgi:hypothetical protein